MIQQKTSPWQTLDWQLCLQETLTSPDDVSQALDLNQNDLVTLREGHRLFPIKIPKTLLNRIKKGNLKDPVLRQFLPSAQETQTKTGYSKDPLSEKEANPVRGLLHKFTHRVLLTVAQHCAVNCRFCFRRHFDYASNSPSRQDWQHAIDYITQNTQIEEVILSGGDPLSVPDGYLQDLIGRIAAIPHVHTLRIHTRFPVMIPQRITDALLKVLTNHRLNTVMVLHCNHANEIDDNVILACELMKSHGIVLLNQTVLLRDINDTLEAQASLHQKLFSIGVLPYYLHAFDPIQGAHHYDVPDDEAKALMQALRDRLPGYCVPRLVREIPGSSSKAILV
jgi:EF-P beta-lysylation protein EpmB